MGITLQTTVSNWSYQPRSQMVNEGAAHKEHKVMRAVCAAVVLDLRVSWTKRLDSSERSFGIMVSHTATQVVHLLPVFSHPTWFYAGANAGSPGRGGCNGHGCIGQQC